jgi:hypothetical protein
VHASQTQQSSLPSQLQQLKQQASASQLPQPQHQQQSQEQLSQGPGQLGMSVLDLPVNEEPFPVSFERVADAEPRQLAQQQARLIAELDDTELDSGKSDTPPSSVEDFTLEEKYGFVIGGSFDGAGAWLEDEGVFDSSDY